MIAPPSDRQRPPKELKPAFLVALATRYDKLTETFLGFVCLAILLTLRLTSIIYKDALGNLTLNDPDYLRWKKNNKGSFSFSSCIKKLRHVTKATAPALAFTSNGWMESLYQKLCAYTHSRPDASDGEMWRSNAPIYVTAAFDRVFKVQLSTYAACYVLAKVGRPEFVLPKPSEFLFSTAQLLCRDDIASSYRALCHPCQHQGA